MWHIHLILAKFLTEIHKLYCVNNFSFVKDSKGSTESIKKQTVSPNKTLVSFDISAHFTSIPVPVAHEVIKRKFTQYINQKGTEHFLQTTCFIPKDKHISLFELVLINCVFFQGMFYQ